MKLLLDECTPKRLKKDFIGHEIFTIDETGFKGMKNGNLLHAASDNGFEVLITVDQNLQYQQNLSSLPIAILILVAKTNRYEDLIALVADALDQLTRIKIGDVVCVKKTS